MNVAIIPARGGSKRIPRKNIKPFCGKPMIAWPIEAARQSGLFDHVVVSTDDDEIAEVATAFGAEAPFRRPAKLADDYTATRPVVNHAIEEIEWVHGRIQYACTIYATSPFLLVDDLKKGFDALQEESRDFAFSVASYPYPIQRALKVTDGGGVEMFHPEHRWTRSQDLEPAYHDAGQFYWGRRDAFLENKPTFSSESYPVILPSWRVVDIDTPEDWTRAEHLFKSLMSA
ncbi:pseudaminic acid cytidylyltransferase [Thioalkalivibrio sp. ALE31]|uniref:pseudaminic acid cytidylyltransferase n=1 Tax=Thioalkalivibrio sp. ALE31 TaxID=1158182 RepID=UPI0003A30E20|nr:pseudaminic acid cytidylyltransferase [Thioalkalivibrio sp. ALE31]